MTRDEIIRMAPRPPKSHPDIAVSFTSEEYVEWLEAALKTAKALLARAERQMTADFRQIDGEWGSGKTDIKTEDSDRASTIRDVRVFLKESQ